MSAEALSAIVGESAPIRRLRAQIRRLAPTPIPVLVQGPTGSGKELVAEALHLLSGRPGRFVPFNVCAVADSMFEDAVFGHVRGAFTGATADVPGYLAEADGGTVLFDEMGGLPLASQPKLLRAIETRRFRPVGAREDRRSDFRVIAATCDDLGRWVEEGRFRPDLLHRVRGATLLIPSLADRLDDIPLLARHFAGPRQLTPCATGALRCYDWPGNVRELRQVMDLAVVMFPDCAVSAAEIRAVLDATARATASEGPLRRAAAGHVRGAGGGRAGGGARGGAAGPGHAAVGLRELPGRGGGGRGDRCGRGSTGDERG